MFEKLSVWLPIIVAWVSGVLIFAVSRSADDVEKNLSTWRARIGRLGGWFARQWWSRPLAIVLITAGSLVAGALIGPMLERGPQPDPKFDHAHAGVPMLGAALSPSEPSLMYAEGHDRGFVIWSQSLGTHYALLPNGSVISQVDTDWAVGDWYKEDEVRRRLNLPPGCLPPIGGIARAWNNDPQWAVLGCRTWACASATIVQRFARGNIIGPVGYGVSAPESSRLIVILKNDKGDDKQWLNHSSPTPASKCSNPI
jgi:hypothetical protein